MVVVPLRILHIVKCQISEFLDKIYLIRKIFQADDPCRDWLNVAVFDSKGPTFCPPFCVFSKICNPTVLCARVRKLLFQVNFTIWCIESVFSQFSRLVSLDFLRFVMTITIVGEVTGNRLTSLFSCMAVEIIHSCLACRGIISLKMIMI